MNIIKTIMSKRFLSTFVLTLFVVCLTAFPGSAEEPGEVVNNPVAEVSIGSNGIGWSPIVEYYQLELTVSTPSGCVFLKTFDRGSTPFLSVSDLEEAQYLEDGSFTYELRVIPKAPEQKRVPEEEGKACPSDKALLQAGSFYILKERFVVPESAKSQPASAAGRRDVSRGQDSLQGQDFPQGQGVSRGQSGEDISIAMDVCYNDDLIVDGSLCVGFDCTCNYSFGFDTIVLKENNLRIFFDDTSVAASFPRNDWRIIINDSANGGASYFGVEDSSAGRRVFTLEAGAPSHSLYVDDGGRIGMGTSTPSVEAHIVDGDTPTLRLEQDGSSGFAPQTWDVAGNETNFFIRDVTNGSTLPLRIQPDAPSNVLTLRADGKVGIGTWSPSQPMHLLTNSSSDATFWAERTSGARAQMSAKSDKTMFGSRTDHKVNITVNNVPKVTIDTTGYIGVDDTTPSHPMEFSVALANGARLESSGNWVNPSSRALKENITSLTAEEAVETINALSPVKFNYKIDKEEPYVGFIAEDVPEMVAIKDRSGLITMDVVAVLTKVVQEQQKIMKTQQEALKKLNARIDELEKKSK